MSTDQIKELKDRIIAWEHKAGESFTDYFMHDGVADRSWAFWLLGKGFTSKANEIIELIVKGDTCIDQETLYYIHQVDFWDEETRHNIWNQENYEKNLEIWAEFLLATALYTQRVQEFFNEEGF